MWHDQGKWVKFLFSYTTFSILQNASFWCKPHYNWISIRLQSYEGFDNAINNMKQRNLNTVFANILKKTSPTSDSFLLIMSHIHFLYYHCHLNTSLSSKYYYFPDLINITNVQALFTKINIFPKPQTKIDWKVLCPLIVKYMCLRVAHGMDHFNGHNKWYIPLRCNNEISL